MDPSISIITTSDLIRLSRHLTGAVSLHPHLSTSPPPPHNPSPLPRSPSRTLEPLNRPALLIGTISLPQRGPSTCGARNPCLAFSDGTSSPLCCSILHIDPEIIGKKLQVLSWNFIPFKNRGGLLEIIRWIPAGVGAESKPVPTARFRLRGLVASVSPVFKAPLADSRDGDTVGFLMELMACECRHCRVDDSCGSNGEHGFTKKVFVYFRGAGSSWHPVVSKLVGSPIAVSGLKKKLVYVEREEPYPLRVSTVETVVRRWRCEREVSSSRWSEKRGRGEMGCYDGVVTGVYMQGMVVELDDRVWLVLADRLLTPSHSLRVGALISVRNVHIVCPNFSWTREVVLGACLKTTVDIKSFSPCDARCPVVLRTQSLLGNFIASLNFSSRFWVLLLVACFRRKFMGLLTDKEILGSKNSEGLVQSYARLYLPCKSQLEHGAFFDFCKHDDFGCCRNYPENGTLKLVPPISSFLSNCGVVLKTIQSQGPMHMDNPGHNQAGDGFICEGSYHARIQRRFVSGDLLGITLVGSLRISTNSGRLQLVDATGSIDVIVPDLPTDSTERLYEVKNYNLVLEWVPGHGEPFASVTRGPLSCRNIFRHPQIGMIHGLTIYVHFYLRDATSLDVSFQRNLDNGMKQPETNVAFHLLVLTHKYPSYDDVADGSAVLDNSSRFAEAFLLPCHLILLEDRGNIHQEPSDRIINKGENGLHGGILDGGGRGSFICQSSDTFENTICLKNSRKGDRKKGSYKIPCVLTRKGCELQGYLFIGNTFPTNGTISESAPSQQIARKVLLTFKSDALKIFESLYVGGFYMLKCSEEELLCHERQKSEHPGYCEIFVHNGKPVWSLSLESDKNPSQNDLLKDVACGFHLDGKVDSSSNLFANTDLNLQEKLLGLEKNFDALLQLSAEVLELLRATLNSELTDGLVAPLWTLSEVFSVSSCIKVLQAVSLHPLGMASTEQNKISLCGNVMDVHFIHNFSDCYFSCKKLIGIHPSRTSSICIHIYEDNEMVKIRGICGNFICPTGFGPGVNATFRRLLITCNSRRWNELTLVATSHIAVNSMVEVFHGDRDVSCLPHNSLDLQRKHPFEKVPPELIGSCHYLENGIMQIRCRVSGVLYLKLEKQSTRTRRLHPWKYGLRRTVKIPIAAFLLDDGSSLCCCWADADKAESLLRFQENVTHASIKRTMSKMSGTGRELESVLFCLEKILKKHHCITAINYGPVGGSYCADISLFVSSNRVLAKSEEKLLKLIIIYASGGPSFNIFGRKMGFNALGQLTKGLIGIQMAKDLQTQHIWALEVGAVDHLAEARSLLHELEDS